jgi:hypothetical protein
MCPETPPRGFSLKRDVSPVSDWGEMSQVWWGALLAAWNVSQSGTECKFYGDHSKSSTLSAAIFIDRHDLRICSY